jgi:hypothetical protein
VTACDPLQAPSTSQRRLYGRLEKKKVEIVQGKIYLLSQADGLLRVVFAYSWLAHGSRLTALRCLRGTGPEDRGVLCRGKNDRGKTSHPKKNQRHDPRKVQPSDVAGDSLSR